VSDHKPEHAPDNPIDAVISFVPGAFAKTAAMEVCQNEIPLLVLTAEGIPDQDMISLLRYADIQGTSVLGPDTPGLISPGKCKLGVHPNPLFTEGRVGIVSKSGSLSYEVGRLLTTNGIGQSTVVGIGGGPIWGLSQQEVLRRFEEDPETEAVILLGEVGGRLEHNAADFIRYHMQKPVVALVVGRTAPEGTQMGHAGAIIEGEEGTADSKIAALKEAGVHIARNSVEIPDIIKSLGNFTSE
jgi:succinyl-CoA synthetase alpha subunit